MASTQQTLNDRGVSDRHDTAEQLQSELLGQLAQQRQDLGLSQQELAERIGRNRMTVQRAEAAGAGVTLSTFVEMALGLGLTPRLATEAEAGSVQPLSRDIVHRGLHHERTRHDRDWRDRQRERALAQAWEAVNVHQDVGLAPILDTLVPGATQEQATAAATVLQWLGSDVGFDFLVRTLGNAGYAVTDERAGVPVRNRRRA